MLVAQNSLGSVCPVPLTASTPRASRGSGERRSRAPLLTPSSPLQRGRATTAHDAAATAGLTVLTSSCSIADAAAAPSFDSARCHEAADRAQTATTALLLRSVSQWVRRVYQPELRRKTDRSLSSPATAICILHVCESRPHAARCACEVHGMKCGWCACDMRWCGLVSAAVSRQGGLGWF